MLKRKNVLMIIMMMAAVIVICFCVTGTVYSKEKHSRKEQEQYYRSVEASYLSAVREWLGRNGYENSGVTMTKVIEEDGNREYTLSIHHRKISNLEEGEQIILKEELAKIDNPMEKATEVSCRIRYYFDLGI